MYFFKHGEREVERGGGSRHRLGQHIGTLFRRK